ncbi:MAG: hypothetical protein KKE44_23450 [Proteobacteria bacterium]|nr:hypothetical protein [Pseudomonadota bacterium]MBU1585688.1 hypothetical protein [Pseudomonadota bacterium]MBU2631206.1 hypothetical protein [Pseudomonadota bacterium]
MEDTIYKLTSPLMGTFYRASAPGNPPLVEIGQKIKSSDVVCVIESMKIFTELRSEYSGIVKEILVENEDLVMKKQPLIIIDKDVSGLI